MSEVIIQLGTRSIQAGLCIGVILLVRGIFQWLNLPKRFSYYLWLVPFLMLLLPWQLKSDFSFFQYTDGLAVYMVGADSRELDLSLEMSEKEMSQSLQGDREKVQETKEEMNHVMVCQESGDAIQKSSSGETVQKETNLAGYTEEKEQTEVAPFQQRILWLGQSKLLHTICFCTWLLGIAVFSGCHARRDWKLRQKCLCSMELESGIYVSDYIEVPFVYGIRKPKIYLPSDIGREELDYVIAHERMHIIRKDYLFKFIAFLLVGVHWFNPFVWIAFRCMESDMEMSCDEAVIQKMGTEKSADYATTLLHLTIGERNRTGISVFFGEGNVEGRIKNIMRKKTVFRGMGVIGFVLILVLAIGFLTIPNDNVSDEIQKNTESISVEDSSMLEQVRESLATNVQKALEEKKATLEEEKQELEKQVDLKEEGMISNQIVAKVLRKEYTLQIVLKKGKVVADELSPYYGMYEGEFVAQVVKGENVESVVLSFGNDVFYFPKNFELYLTDYNGDGLEDFALGQRIGSNHMEYQFFTIMKSGKIKQLLIDRQGAKAEKTLIASDMAYSPDFSKKAEAEGKEKQKILYKEYQMDTGRYVKKEAVLHL